jgi:Cu-processing system permease protein
VKGALVIAGFALRESIRRRVFVVVALLTLLFLVLYGLGVNQVYKETENLQTRTGVDPEVVAGAVLLGLSMFGTLFLGAILAVFLTLGAVGGDAERGLLQPLVVRPLPRATFLLGRFAGAAVVCALYVVVVFLACVVITWAIGGWWPDRTVLPAVALAAAVAVVVAVSLAGSVRLAATANGIAVFMLFGAGLVAGLLGQIGDALGSETLSHVSRIASWALPFEALYQSALSAITADTVGFTRLAVNLGPFGGAASYGPLLGPFTLAYLLVVGALALHAFARRDL